MYAIRLAGCACNGLADAPCAPLERKIGVRLFTQEGGMSVMTTAICSEVKGRGEAVLMAGMYVLRKEN